MKPWEKDWSLPEPSQTQASPWNRDWNNPSLLNQINTPEARSQAIGVPVGDSATDSRLYNEIYTPEQQAQHRANEQQTREQRQEREGLSGKGFVSAVKDFAVGLPGGMYNAARDTALVGTALAERGAEAWLNDPLDGATLKVHETIPEFEPENEAQEVISEFFQFGTGAGIGTKIGSALTKNMIADSLKQKALKGGALLVAGELGMTATAGSSEPFLIPATLGLDGNEEFSEALLQKRLNFLLDSTITSIGVGGALSGATIGGGYGKTLFGNMFHKWRNLNAIQKDYVTHLIDLAGNVQPGMSKEEVTKIRQEVRDFMVANAKTHIELADKYVDNPEFTNDTITTLIQYAKSKGNREVALELEQMRSSALTGGSPKLEQALNRPTEVLDETMSSMRQGRGGNESVQQAGDEFVAQAQQEITPYRNNERAARSELSRAEQGIDELIRNDPTFSEILKKLGNKVRIEFRNVYEAPASDIAEKIARAGDLMTQQKNRLWAAIPDSSKVNPVALADALEEAIQKGVLGPELTTKISAAGDSFKKLQEVANFDISDAISEAYNANKPARAKALRDLKHHIVGEQLDYLTISGDTITRDAALKAREFYMKEYAPFWKDNPVLEEILHISRTRSDLEAMPQARKQVYDQFGNKDFPERTKNMLDLMARQEAGESSDLAMDYVLGRIANEIRSIINTGKGLTPENTKYLQEYIGQFTPILDKLSPSKREEVETFFTSLRDQSFDVEKLQTKLVELEQLSKDRAKEIFGRKYQEFFQATDGGFKATPNKTESFSKIFKNPQNKNRIEEFIFSISDNPAALEGMQTAYLDTLRKEYFAGKTLKAKDIAEIDLDDPLYEYGKMIFGNSAVIDGLNQVAEFAAAGKRANITRGSQGLPTGDNQQDFKTGVNMVTTWIFGVLNPTAARIRTITNDLSKKYDSKNIAKQAADIILSDAETFSKIAGQVIRDKQRFLTIEQKRMLINSAVKAGIYDPGDTEKLLQMENGDTRTLDQQMEDSFK